MQTRLLGGTGERVSAVGLGGFHMAKGVDAATSTRIIRAAVDGGITFLDNSWDYHEGESERRMGNALRDGYRQRVFLMTKIDGQTRQSAMAQLHQSLERLQTDWIDLIQLHEIIRPEDPDRIFQTDGAIHALKEAKQQGLIRYIGFTGHKSPDVHLKMLTKPFSWDTVQMPLNLFDYHFDSFGERVLPVLLQRGIGVLGMKPMGAGKLLESGAVTAEECLRYALTLPTSVVITGCESIDQVEQALRAGRGFQPMSTDELQSIRDRTAAPALAGRYETYKTTDEHDGTKKHPEWLGLAAA